MAPFFDDKKYNIEDFKYLKDSEVPVFFSEIRSYLIHYFKNHSIINPYNCTFDEVYEITLKGVFVSKLINYE